MLFLPIMCFFLAYQMCINNLNDSRTAALGLALEQSMKHKRYTNEAIWPSVIDLAEDPMLFGDEVRSDRVLLDQIGSDEIR